MVTPADLAIEGAVVLDAYGEPRRANVYVRDGVVDAVTEDVRPAERTLRRDGAVVISGFANLHLHTRPGRALGDGLPMREWHDKWADGLTRRMRDGDGYAGAALAFSECLLGGTTSVVVMTPRYGEAAQAARDLGIRAIVVPLAVDVPGSEGTGDPLDRSLEEIAALGPQRDELVRIWLGFDSTYSASEAGLRAVAEAARSIPLGVHTHMSEETHDARMRLGSKDLYGAYYFDDVGFFGLPEPIVLAHCNWLEPGEIELLAGAVGGAIVSHNPTSNMHLGTGTCPVPELLEAGVRVGLGTDGLLSNYHLDMFEVMRGAAMLQRVAKTDARALGSAETLRLATHGGGVFGARAGELAAGAPADLAVLQLDGVRFTPRVDLGEDSTLLAFVVWCAGAGDVTDVVVAGRIVVEDRQLLTGDTERIVADAQRAFDRIRTTPLS